MNFKNTQLKLKKLLTLWTAPINIIFTVLLFAHTDQANKSLSSEAEERLSQNA